MFGTGKFSEEIQMHNIDNISLLSIQFRNNYIPRIHPMIKQNAIIAQLFRNLFGEKVINGNLNSY